jgi:hypothetical protein
MPDMNLHHLGAEETVTGSCHLVQANGVNLLVDCGLAQGGDAVVPMESWPVKPAEIDYLFLTHAHLDHIGRVPELLRAGFSGEILCTHATKALLGPMLEDALGFTDYSRAQKRKLLADLDELSRGFEYGEDFSLKKGLRFRLGRAGHISQKRRDLRGVSGRRNAGAGHPPVRRPAGRLRGAGRGALFHPGPGPQSVRIFGPRRRGGAGRLGPSGETQGNPAGPRRGPRPAGLGGAVGADSGAGVAFKSSPNI